MAEIREPTKPQGMPTPDEVRAMPAGAELDALVARVAFGIDVLGMEKCWKPDGCWSVYPNGNDCVDRPVYVRECYCNDDMNESYRRLRSVMGKSHGHWSTCLEVVPSYSSDPAACAVLERRLFADGWEIETRWYPQVERIYAALIRFYGLDRSEISLSAPAGSDPVAVRCLLMSRVGVLAGMSGEVAR